MRARVAWARRLRGPRDCPPGDRNRPGRARSPPRTIAIAGKPVAIRRARPARRRFARPLIKRDGNEMYIESTASPIRDGTGGVAAAMNASVHASRWTLDDVHEELLPRLQTVAALIERDARAAADR